MLSEENAQSQFAADAPSNEVEARFALLERRYVEEQRQSVYQTSLAADALVRAELDSLGPLHIFDGELFAGPHPIAGNTDLVDRVKNETGFGCTIFLGNRRIATTATADGTTERAYDTSANEQVTQRVLFDGEVFLGITRTIGKDWVIRYTPLHDVSDTIVGMIATFYEQTEFMEGLKAFKEKLAEAEELAKLAEEQALELAHMNRTLKEADRMKDEFLANMSHELRTPLNAILGTCESFHYGVYGQLGDRQQKPVATIEKNGKHLLQLINDILDLSKITNEKGTIYKEETSLVSLCQDALDTVREQAAHKGLKVLFNPQSDIDIIETDVLKCKQILINLLGNAVKFTKNGSIGLGVAFIEAEGLLSFDVWDTGIGMNQEDLQKILQPFYQVDSSDTRRHGGTGLGLALVDGLSKLLGGDLQVKSTAGEGTTFTVNIPIPPPTRKSNVHLNEHERKDTHVVCGQGRRLLLVEDNEENIKTIAGYLEHLGFQVRIARDGLQGVSMSVTEEPALVLMDLQMPGIDGLEAIKRIRKAPKTRDVPIISLTARAMAVDKQKCLEAGANFYLPKPVQLSLLAQTIDQLIPQE